MMGNGAKSTSALLSRATIATPLTKIELPKGMAIGSSDVAAVRDNLGVYWFTLQGRLYKSISGAYVEVFSEGEAHPFSSTQRIKDVFVDRTGDAFLKTVSLATFSESWFQISPRSPPPDTFITLERTAGDSLKALLRTDSRSRVRYRWQLDDGPAHFAEEGVLFLNSLPYGRHKLTVATLDGDLQADTTPAIATFESR